MESDSSLDSNHNFDYSESNFDRLIKNPHLERHQLNDREWRDKLRHMIGEFLRYESETVINLCDLRRILNLTPTPWTAEDVVFFFHELQKSSNVDDGQECRAILEYVGSENLNINYVFEEVIKTSGMSTLWELMDFAQKRKIVMEVDSIIRNANSLKETVSRTGLGPETLNILVGYANAISINLGPYGRGAIRKIAYEWFGNENDKEQDNLSEQREVEKALLANRTCDRPA